MKVKSLSPVWSLATPWTAAYQAPPSLGFSRQEYWSGLPFPSLGYSLPCHIITFCVVSAVIIKSLHLTSFLITIQIFFTYLLFCLLSIQDLFIYILFVCSLNNTSLSSLFSCWEPPFYSVFTNLFFRLHIQVLPHSLCFSLVYFT